MALVESVVHTPSNGLHRRGARSPVSISPAAPVARDGDPAKNEPQTGKNVVARAVRVARSRGSVRRVVAVLAARFVETRGWERLGFARLDDYARERVGLSARQLYEFARTSELLRELPLVGRALQDGRLSWTQARLIGRAAGPDDEVDWIALAHSATTAELERRVRAVDRCAIESGGADVDEDGLPVAPRETLLIRCSAAVRGKWQHGQTLARRVSGERLTPGQCAEVIAAEVLSAIPLDGGLESSAVPPHERQGGGGCHPSEPADQRSEPADSSEPPQRVRAAACETDRPTLEAATNCDPFDGGSKPASDRNSSDCTSANRWTARRSGVWGAKSPPGRRIEFGRGTFALRTIGRRSQTGEPSRLSPRSGDAGPGDLQQEHVTSELHDRLASLVEGLEDADAFALDSRLRRAVAAEQGLEAELGALLLRSVELRCFERGSSRSFEVFARERLGMSPRKARALLRLERAGRRCPELREAYRKGRLSWVRAHTVVSILRAAPGWAAHWVEWAARVSVRRLQDDVDHALLVAETAHGALLATGGLPLEALCGGTDSAEAGSRPRSAADAIVRTATIAQTADLDAAELGGSTPRAAAEPAGLGGPSSIAAPQSCCRKTCCRKTCCRKTCCRQTRAQRRDWERTPSPGRTPRTGQRAGIRATVPQIPPPLETCRVFFNAPRDVARLFHATLCTVHRALERHWGRLATEGEALEAMLDHVFGVWDPLERSVPRAHAVFERDGWRCTVPACSSYRNLQDHHIRFRSAGGSDALENQTTLCAWHHLRGVHAGLVSCRGRSPGELRFALGVRKRHRPLAAYRSGDVIEEVPMGG